MRDTSGRIIVKFKSAQDRPAVFELQSRSLEMFGVGVKNTRILNPRPTEKLFSVSLADRSEQNKIVLIELAETGEKAVENAVSKFEASGEVEYAEKDYTVRLASSNITPTDIMQTCGGCLYGIKKVGADRAWSITEGDSRVIVGILDTGIDTGHIALYKNIWENPNAGAAGYENDVHGYDFVNRIGIDRSNMFNDKDGHGTHVAGIVGSHGTDDCSVTGVARNIRLAVIKVIGTDGTSNTAEIIEGLNYANNAGIPITNNSYVIGHESKALKETIESGGLFVAIAGNEPVNIDEVKRYPACYGCENIITVAATDSKDKLAAFSGYSRRSVDIAAPGMYICSALARVVTGMISEWDIGGYITESGTSMAAPHVAGAAALVLSRLIALRGVHNIDMRKAALEVKKLILGSADILPNLTESVSGGRRLNVYEAVRKTVE